MYSKLVTFTFCFLSIGNGFAQIAKDSTVRKFQQEPVEIIANIASENAPFTKQKITSAQIAKMNLGQDIPFLLNQTPSVVISSDAGNGVGYTGIRIRGTDATRINMTINGVPYNDAESQGVFFVDLPDLSSSISSLQIQRGVGSSSNGTAAFGGTLSFSTSGIVPEKPELSFYNSFGSFNTRKHNMVFQSGKIGKYVSIGTRISHILSNGFIDRASSDLNSSLVNLEFAKKKTTLKFNWIAGKEKTYQAWNGISEADRLTNRTYNSAGTERPGEPYKNETDNYNQKHLQLIWNQQLNAKWNFSATGFLSLGSGYYEQYKAGQLYSKYGFSDLQIGSVLYTNTDLIRQLWLDNKFYGQLFSVNYAKNQTKFSFGGSITRYDGKHFGEIIWAERGLGTNPTRWYHLTANKHDFAGYLKWEERIGEGLFFYADAQVRHIGYSINGFRENPRLHSNNKYTFFNPKIGFTYDANKYRFSLSYAVANKEPNRDDFEAGKNQIPKPEQLQDLELNFIPRFSGAFLFSATAYWMHYKDQLILTGKINDVGAYTRENTDKSFRTGLELQAEKKLVPWLKISGNISFSANKIKRFTEFIDDYDNGTQISQNHTNTNIAYSPAVVSAATLCIQPVKNLEICFLGKYSGKQYLDNTQNENRKLNAFFTQDVLLHFELIKKKLPKFTVTAQANNVFNKKYEPNGYSFSYRYNGRLNTENFYFPMAGRHYMLGLFIGLKSKQ